MCVYTQIYMHTNTYICIDRILWLLITHWQSKVLTTFLFTTFFFSKCSISWFVPQNISRLTRAVIIHFPNCSAQIPGDTTQQHPKMILTINICFLYVLFAFASCLISLWLDELCFGACPFTYVLSYKMGYSLVSLTHISLLESPGKLYKNTHAQTYSRPVKSGYLIENKWS